MRNILGIQWAVVRGAQGVRQRRDSAGGDTWGSRAPTWGTLGVARAGLRVGEARPRRAGGFPKGTP